VVESRSERHANRSTHASICRFCAANCPILVEIEDGRPIRVTGNRSSPLFDGFCCSRGQALPEHITSPSRLLRPLRRTADGSHGVIASTAAIAEIADRIRAIVDRHGPSSVAIYHGTHSTANPASTPVSLAWMRALGSPMLFNSGTIDQPGKNVAAALLGSWDAGVHPFLGADVWMLVGANPLVSIGITIPAQNPARHLTQALERGMQLIVIDPRRTETARRAHVHLQPRPGQDAAILAAMIHVILEEGLLDEAFVQENVDGVAPLRAAVGPFTPAYAASRADVPAESIVRAARVFAQARRGLAVGSTGANMSGRSTLTEYLLLCLNTLCGRYIRAGEPATNPGVLLSRATPRAQPSPPRPAVFPDLKLSVRGLAMSVLGMPTAALADEILAGNIRALFSLGGNPVAAWPNQNHTIAALDRLELFVQMDVRMSASAKVAHYVLPPPLSFETPTMSYSTEFLELINAGWGFSQPFGMYAPKVLDHPPDSDLVEEWELFYGMAQRLGLSLTLNPINTVTNSSLREPRESSDLDMQRKPTTDELFELIVRGSRIPLAEVKRHPNGALFPEQIAAVPRDPLCTAKLDVGNEAMMGELGEVAADPGEIPIAYPFVLIGRRMTHVYNSSGRDLPTLAAKGGTFNPAFMHPADLAELGVAVGDRVAITSRHGTIHGIVAADATLRRGLVSMSHAFGGLPREADDVRTVGSNTSQLTSVDEDYDRYSGIPRMSAVPVRVQRTTS
jgi:anaerobic selenocysteine-containing dehydrogenase